MTSSTLAPTFATGHVGLNVTDLDRGRDFYVSVFGWEVQAEGREDGRHYAFLGDGDRTVLTLWEQADRPFAATGAGLHHLSFQVDSIDEVRAVEARVRAAGTRLYHDGIVPHAEGESSGGIFFEDPDGTRLEVYAPSGADTAEHGAPSGAAPTCGFF